LVNGIEIPLSKKQRQGKEIPFCVLEKMRITYSNLDICKKNNLKSYRRDCRKTLFLTLFLSNFLHLFLLFQISFTNDQKCGIS
jgi:hypothetical protein